MNLIHQPTRKTCGQTCVAMLANLDVNVVVSVMGDRTTKYHDLRDGLIMAGKSVSPLQRVPKSENVDIPGTAVFMKQCKKDGKILRHWIVIGRMMPTADSDPNAVYVFDPARVTVYELSRYRKKYMLRDGSYFTSFFVVW